MVIRWVAIEKLVLSKGITTEVILKYICYALTFIAKTSRMLVSL